MHSVLGDGVVSHIDGLELGGFQNLDKFHYRIDAQPHRVQVEHAGVLLGVYFVEALLKHLGLLDVGLLPGVLASRQEYL